MKHAKISIIGAGNVGATVAYALMMRDLVSDITIFDIDQQRLMGQVKDLTDALSFSRTSYIGSTDIAQAGQADVVIITAGKGQAPGQTRADLLKTNSAIIRDIIKKLKPFGKDTIIILVTNPVDVMTMIAQEESGLPRNRVFGSGTFLDTQRLRSCIGTKLGIAEQSVHAYVLGEHGDAQFVAWSNADIGGVPLSQFPSMDKATCQAIAQQSKEKVYEIVKAKGSTYFGVAACVSAYCENILFDQKRVLPLSCYQKDLGICLSMPAVLGAKGIEQVLSVPLDDDEQKLLAVAADKVRGLYNSL